MSDHDEIQSFYDEVYYKNASEHVAPSRHLRNLAEKYVQPGNRVLDVACGTGNWLMATRERGAIPSGIDLSAKAINICRANMPEGEFRTGPAETLPFPDKSFDIITCLGSLEHFLDPVSAVQEMVRVSRDDALFIILVPNSGFITRRLGLYKGTYQTAAKEEVRTLDAWNRIFESGGLVVRKRWKDLHVVSWAWINSAGWLQTPLRALQALSLPFWPVSWQYQVYHLLVTASETASPVTKKSA